MEKRGTKNRANASRPGKRGASGRKKPDGLALHRDRCAICKHPDREEIEREFLDWVSPRELAEQWKMASYRSIYRHAHAMGLFEKRRKNWRGALERIIERVGEVQVTAAAVVSAIRLSAKLDRDEKEKDTPGVDPRQLGFRLVFDGLPRTDAVTGHANVVAVGRDDPVGRPPAAKAPSNPPLSTTPPEPATEDGDSPSDQGNDAPAPGEKKGARTGRQKTSSQGASAPQVTQPAPVEPDPRIALSEDGRVAGVPWPKGKITFARRGRGRWHPGRAGR